MSPAPRSAALADVSVYGRLRHGILTLDHLPGERLTERGLEDRLGSSRTPIRAALLRLEADGLVRRDGRGWAVAPIDLAEIRALAEYREAIEVAAVRMAGERASDDDLAALADAIATDDDDDLLRPGAGFHEVIGRLSGNIFLADGLAGAMTRLLRPRWLEMRTDEARSRAAAEHREIADALIARDAERAAELVRAHVRSGAQRTVETLAHEQRRLRGHGLAVVDDG
ncbi:GntR family transcriptional regulator [Microbacterium resistens]|uniref:GntR family transcriptional regulator n=1 Tax=Microbacterium resistens TaxID=156977 RepID=UPI001C58646A|nr:GntR family transcriptional regulator [Microbacterium resistens]MBW1638720.1 GntR family transcriptional regulator [Microbacterium resistens]